jgi:predicted N-acetyltransferase YhbS
MAAQAVPYDHDRHFPAVRDLLVEQYPHQRRHSNWDVGRWNYARYMVVHLQDGDEGVGWWEQHVRVWEDEAGRVLGACHTEDARAGQAWIQRRIEADGLLPEMVAWAEENLAGPGAGQLQLNIATADVAFMDTAAAAGFVREPGPPHNWEYRSVVGTAELPDRPLPPGFRFGSMAEDNDVERKREGLGRGFGHDDPSEWTSAETYRLMQSAPDYRPELDVHAIAPDGRYVSTACLWLDEHNRMATLEPVSTHPDFRRRGLASAVCVEGARRAAARGARTVWVNAIRPLYLRIGMRPYSTMRAWRKG